MVGELVRGCVHGQLVSTGCWELGTDWLPVRWWEGLERLGGRGRLRARGEGRALAGLSQENVGLPVSEAERDGTEGRVVSVTELNVTFA